MGRSLKIKITETSNELSLMLTRLKTARNLPRIQMLYWLKTGQVSTRKELVKLTGHHEATITRWLNLYRQGGIKQLLEIKKAPGKSALISGKPLEALKENLSEPTGFRSYGEVKDWLEENYGVKAAYQTVHKTVKYKLGGKLKTPRPSHLKKDEQAEEHFKKN